MSHSQSQSTVLKEQPFGEDQTSGEEMSIGESPSKEDLEEKPSTQRQTRKSSKSKSNTKVQEQSKSTKSESDSQVQARSLRKNLISRVLRNRDVKLSELNVDHMKYLWAAYRMGVWNHLLEEDLTKEQFSLLIVELAETSRLMIIENKKPLGLVSVREDGRVVEPHIDWFPWSTDRNKLEGAIRITLDLREIKPVLVWVTDETKQFFTHIAKYGIMRRVGTFHGDQKYAIFQSKEA